MTNQNVAMTALNQRVWYVEGGVYPTRSPEFLPLGKVSTDPSQGIGEATKISAPDPTNYSRDIQVGTVPGEIERAKLSIGARFTAQKAILAEWKNKKCRVDIFVLSGKCGNVQDFTDGGEKWLYFPDGQISNHAFENLGAYGRDENNPTNEMVDMTSRDYWEYLYMRQDQIGSSDTIREIYTIDVYPGDDCEDCPDQFKKVIMTMAGASATPGTQPSLLYSSDAGESFSSQTISTLFSNEVVKDTQIIGGNIFIISPTSNSIHWTSVEMLYDGTNTWQEVNSGFVAAKTPNKLTSADVRHNWIVADGGYIYFSNNLKLGVTVQDAGVATTQNLNCAHAYDTKNVLAVGNSNAVVFTTNGGLTWESAVGPAVGIHLGACWMWDAQTWFVGEGAGGNGKVWLTTNSGKSWSQVSLPANYVRIDKIKFVSEAEGFISVRTAGQGLILRTITAGNQWVVLPQGKRGIPLDNTYISDIAVCAEYSNTVYAAGLNNAGTGGVAYRFAGS